MAFRSDRRLCLTRDGARVCEPDDKEAAFLFATPGTDISEEDAERFGLEFVDHRVVLPGKKSAKKSEDKSAKKSEEKAPEVATARPPAPPEKPEG